MTQSRENVLALIITMYGEANLNEVLTMLDEYGIENVEPEVNRVQLAILQLSEGNKDKLLYLVKTAKVDYRDILAWQQLGSLSPEEGEKWQATAQTLIDRWGKK